MAKSLAQSVNVYQLPSYQQAFPQQAFPTMTLGLQVKIKEVVPKKRWQMTGTHPDHRPWGLLPSYQQAFPQQVPMP